MAFPLAAQAAQRRCRPAIPSAAATPCHGPAAAHGAGAQGSRAGRNPAGRAPTLPQEGGMAGNATEIKNKFWFLSFRGLANYSL
jgi:hypothetical protein